MRCGRHSLIARGHNRGCTLFRERCGWRGREQFCPNYRCDDRGDVSMGVEAGPWSAREWREGTRDHMVIALDEPPQPSA